MITTTIPTPGINALTKRLLAAGVDPAEPDTWPQGVWRGDGPNFLYSREWIYTPTWESPCGLLIHTHGDCWGDTWVNGEFKCAENDNPLFGCPTPGKPCPHRLRMPPGMNCQFHRTEREWNEAQSVERLEKLREQRKRELWIEDTEKYPEWDGRCINLKTEELPDGGVRRAICYDLDRCISIHCTSPACICRLGARRNLRKANIYYDVYHELHGTRGMVRHTEKKLIKGLKVFDRAVAMTDAEIALKIWRHDPDNSILPHSIKHRLKAKSNLERHEEFFIQIHGIWDDYTDVEIISEIRNIRIAATDERDMMQDLRDVQDGIEVVHDSDLKAAKAAQKSDARKRRKVEKLGKRYAWELEQKKGYMVMRGITNEDMKDAVRKEAQRILAKKAEEREKQEQAKAQISIFDL